MSEPFIVLLLLSAPDARDPASVAMTATARKTLEGDAVVLVDERSTLPSDNEALALAERVHAKSVVEVIWRDPTHDRALVHVHVARTAEWLDREVTFDTSDAPLERGRSVGLTVATMILQAEQPPVVAPAPSETPSPGPDRVPAKAEPPPPPTAPEPERTWHALLDVTGVESVGIGGTAGGAGFALGGGWSPKRDLWLHVGGQARFGEIPEAAASGLVLSFAAGAGWDILATSGSTPVVLEVRSDVHATREAVSRSGATRSRWVGAVDLGPDAAWFFTTHLAGLVGARSELSFGPTEVSVDGVRVARFSTFRVVGHLGVRARF